MKKKIITAFFMALLLLSISIGQVTFTRNYFYDLQAFKLLDFDFAKGANNPNIFSYSLSYYGDEPKQLVLEASFTATLPGYGTKFQNVNLAHIKTKPFDFLGSITITTLDIDESLENLYYDGTEEEIVFHGNEIEEFIEESDFNIVRDDVLATGELPVGQYVFNIAIYENGSVVGSDQKVIEISSSSSLELIEPGGTDLDVASELHTTFPIFRWNTDAVSYDENYCSECGLYVRIAEFDSVAHSSFEDAFSGNYMVLPKNGGYEKLPSVLDASGVSRTIDNFIYPIDAKRLEEGKSYVWQLKKEYPSTSGVEEIESEIFVFKIAGSSGFKSDDIVTSTNARIMSMIELIAPNEIDQINEQLEGFIFSGEINKEGQSISVDELNQIINQLKANPDKIKSITVEE